MEFIVSLMSKYKGSTKDIGAWALIGLTYLAPMLILAYGYSIVAPLLHDLLSGLAFYIFAQLGIKLPILSSAPVCMILAFVILSAIGLAFQFAWGAIFFKTLDKLLCKLPFYASLRELIRLPDTNGHSQNQPDDGSSMVWAWTSYGWSPAVVKDETSGVNGITMLTVMFLAAPIPSAWNIGRVNKSWTAPCGLTFGAWVLWKESGGGALPAGAIEAPDHAPQFLTKGT